MTHTIPIRPTRRTVLAAAAAAMVPAVSVRAQDSTWPSRPIKVLLPSSPGAASDQLARLLYERLSTALKQPILVENRPGASGTIATMAAIRSEPDGYTLLHSNASSTVMAEALVPKLPFSTLRDLQPVGLTAVGGVMLAVHPDVPARNLGELVALLKSQPDRYPSYASWAVGSNGHLTMEWLKQQTGIRINHVPYRTMGTLLTDLSSGVVHIAWTDIVSPMGFIQQGRVRPIAINGELRSPRLPDLPTMTEQGHPFPATGWQGVFVPKGTPDAIVHRLHAEINKVLAIPEFQEAVKQKNVPPVPIWSRAQFESMLANDLKVWKQIVVNGNIQIAS